MAANPTRRLARLLLLDPHPIQDIARSVNPEDDLRARRIFGRQNPVGRVVRIGGRATMVIGLYTPASNIFQPPGSETLAIVPYRMLDQQFDVDRTNELFIVIKPRAGVTVDEAQEAATITLRELRGLRLSPAEAE